MDHGHREKPVRFVILFQGKVDSTYLTEALGSHSNVCAKGEWFNGQKGKAAQLTRMREYFEHSVPDDCDAQEFKVKLKDVGDPAGFASLLKEIHTQAIYLDRRNRIKLLVSLYNSQRLHDTTGDWNLYKHDDRPRSFSIDPTDFQARLAWMEEGRQALRNFVLDLELPALWLYYEDLLTHQQRTIQTALSFLNARPQRVEGRCIKKTSDRLRDVVEKFDELRLRYLGTRDEHMFDQVSTPPLDVPDGECGRAVHR